MDKSFLLHAIAVLFDIGMYCCYSERTDINTMIIACMIGVSQVAVLTVFLIDKLFLGRIAELGTDCYFQLQNRVLQLIW